MNALPYAIFSIYSNEKVDWISYYFVILSFVMATNGYGFDFLKTEHKYDDDNNHFQQQPDVVPITSSTLPSVDAIASAHLKPDLEKQFDTLAFLQKHRGSGSALAPSLIYQSTGIDLETDVNVATMLQSNPKVRTEFIPDPENPSLQVAHYAYQAKYTTVRDRASLLAQINRMDNGVPFRDLEDSYDGIDEDIDALITAGDVIAVQNSEDKDRIIFPRGEAFYVELDGLLCLPDPPSNGNTVDTEASATITASTSSQEQMPKGKKSPKMVDSRKRSPKFEPSSSISNPDMDDRHGIFGVNTDVDPCKQIRRGEAILVGGQWFRISSSVRAGVSLKEQPVRAQAPLSVVSREEMSKRNEVDGYIRPFAAKHVPLDHALTETAQQNIRDARHAREVLLKLGHGRSVTSQLTGSFAHSSNPTTLASSFTTVGTPSLLRKQRPTKVTSSASTNGIGPGLSEQQLTKAALEDAAGNLALAHYSHARRHGCTLDVRGMYLATASVVPETDRDLRNLLIEYKLLDKDEEIRRPRLTKSGSNIDNDGKPKKRRYYERKSQRMTNTHLEGTEIGALLARATEQQKQGKSVGDGGM